jgi:hypothetical protein
VPAKLAIDDRRIVPADDVECSGRKDSGGCTVQVRNLHQPRASIVYKVSGKRQTVSFVRYISIMCGVLEGGSSGFSFR